MLFEVMWWFFQFLSIFLDFDFTDWEDFTPLISLVLGIAGAIYFNTQKKKPPSIAVYVLMVLLAIWPILSNIGLYFLAREYQSLFRSWPEVMVSDPKNVYGNGHVTYDSLFQVVSYLQAFAGAWMANFIALFLANGPRLSATGTRIIWTTFGISMLLYFLDIGNLSAWWID